MKIFIVCGGTGGHLYPGISIYNALKKKERDLDVRFVLDRRAVTSLIIPEDYPRVYTSLTPIKLNFNLQSPGIVLRLIKGVFQSLWLLVKGKPDIVVGFGGYASFFVLIFARIFKIKTVIHESNVTPGRVNRILANFCDKIAVGFIKTKDFFSGANSFKVEFTGNPLRANLVRIEKIRAYEFFSLPRDRFTILVMGGSQGAHRINTVFLETAALLQDKSKIQIIHLSGQNDYKFLLDAYKGLDVEVRVFPFLEKMEYAYSAADIAVSRAGAASLSEMAFFSLPAILIPYPYAYRHQLDNAQYFYQNQAVMLIEEQELNADNLKQKILSVFDKPELLKRLSVNMSAFSSPQADIKLAELILNN